MGKYLAVFLPALFWFGGCQGGSAICNALNECGAAPSRCELYFDALILPDGCAEAIVAAECQEHFLEVPSYMDLCFPPCGADSAVCAGDIITACFDGRTTTSKCALVCKLADMKYSGVCAEEYQGQTSEDGQDLCWCD